MNIQHQGIESLSPRTAATIHSLFEVMMLLLQREVSGANVELSLTARSGSRVAVIAANTSTLWEKTE